MTLKTKYRIYVVDLMHFTNYIRRMNVAATSIKELKIYLEIIYPKYQVINIMKTDPIYIAQ